MNQSAVYHPEKGDADENDTPMTGSTTASTTGESSALFSLCGEASSDLHLPIVTTQQPRIRSSCSSLSGEGRPSRSATKAQTPSCLPENIPVVTPEVLSSASAQQLRTPPRYGLELDYPAPFSQTSLGTPPTELNNKQFCNQQLVSSSQPQSPQEARQGENGYYESPPRVSCYESLGDPISPLTADHVPIKAIGLTGSWELLMDGETERTPNNYNNGIVEFEYVAEEMVEFFDTQSTASQKEEAQSEYEEITVHTGEEELNYHFDSQSTIASESIGSCSQRWLFESDEILLYTVPLTQNFDDLNSSKGSAGDWDSSEDESLALQSLQKNLIDLHLELDEDSYDEDEDLHSRRSDGGDEKQSRIEHSQREPTPTSIAFTAAASVASHESDPPIEIIPQTHTNDSSTRHSRKSRIPLLPVSIEQEEVAANNAPAIRPIVDDQVKETTWQYDALRFLEPRRRRRRASTRNFSFLCVDEDKIYISDDDDMCRESKSPVIDCPARNKNKRQRRQRWVDQMMDRPASLPHFLPFTPSLDSAIVDEDKEQDQIRLILRQTNDISAYHKNGHLFARKQHDNSLPLNLCLNNNIDDDNDTRSSRCRAPISPYSDYPVLSNSQQSLEWLDQYKRDTRLPQSLPKPVDTSIGDDFSDEAQASVFRRKPASLVDDRNESKENRRLERVDQLQRAKTFPRNLCSIEDESDDETQSTRHSVPTSTVSDCPTQYNHRRLERLDQLQTGTSCSVLDASIDDDDDFSDEAQASLFRRRPASLVGDRNESKENRRLERVDQLQRAKTFPHNLCSIEDESDDETQSTRHSVPTSTVSDCPTQYNHRRLERLDQLQTGTSCSVLDASIDDDDEFSDEAQASVFRRRPASVVGDRNESKENRRLERVDELQRAKTFPHNLCSIEDESDDETQSTRHSVPTSTVSDCPTQYNHRRLERLDQLQTGTSCSVLSLPPSGDGLVDECEEIDEETRASSCRGSTRTVGDARAGENKNRRLDQKKHATSLPRDVCSIYEDRDDDGDDDSPTNFNHRRRLKRLDELKCAAGMRLELPLSQPVDSSIDDRDDETRSSLSQVSMPAANDTRTGSHKNRRVERLDQMKRATSLPRNLCSIDDDRDDDDDTQSTRSSTPASTVSDCPTRYIHRRLERMGQLICTTSMHLGLALTNDDETYAASSILPVSINSGFTQTRADTNASSVRPVSVEEDLGIQPPVFPLCSTHKKPCSPLPSSQTPETELLSFTTFRKGFLPSKLQRPASCRSASPSLDCGCNHGVDEQQTLPTVRHVRNNVPTQNQLDLYPVVSLTFLANPLRPATVQRVMKQSWDILQPGGTLYVCHVIQREEDLLRLPQLTTPLSPMNEPGELKPADDTLGSLEPYFPLHMKDYMEQVSIGGVKQRKYEIETKEILRRGGHTGPTLHNRQDLIRRWKGVKPPTPA